MRNGGIESSIAVMYRVFCRNCTLSYNVIFNHLNMATRVQSAADDRRKLLHVSRCAILDSI